MKILIWDPQNYKPMEIGLSFAEGLKKHNIDFEFSADPHKENFRNKKVDLLVHWGRTIKRADEVNLKYKDYLKAERAFFEDRYVWASYGFNGLNNRADFCNENMPSDRWEKHFNDGRMKEWNPKGDYILLCEQIRGDSSLIHYDANYTKIINDIRAHTDLPIHVKKHPRVRPKTEWSYVKKGVKFLDKTVPINEAINKCKVVVSVNSNVGVDATLAGKPTIALDKGSMVWNLAEKNYDRINDDIPEPTNRMQWAYNMAYTQWLSDEVKNGETWEHLKKYYEKNDISS